MRIKWIGCLLLLGKHHHPLEVDWKSESRENNLSIGKLGLLKLLKSPNGKINREFNKSPQDRLNKDSQGLHVNPCCETFTKVDLKVGKCN